MKKSRKILIGVSSGVVVAAVAGTLLGIYIPELLTQNNIATLVEKQVKPTEGNNSYLRSTIKNALGTKDSNIGDIKSFATEALNSTSGYNSVLGNTVNNYLTQFFKFFKGSDSYTERYKTWNDEINTQWDDLVKSYKDKHGGTWEYFFQVNVLDPVGGNEADWKREKLFTNVENAFNEFLFQNLYITAQKNGKPMIPTSSPTIGDSQYLYSKELVNGATSGVATPGARNQVLFKPTETTTLTTPYAGAVANLQSFVFDQYVEETMPLVTSMTLYKHDAPQKDSKSNFFNIQKAKEISNPVELADVVGQEGSYMWQTFAPALTPTGSTGEFVPTATNKYMDFVNNQARLVNSETGAIEIPAKLYTDDSATLYFVKMNDVFSSSFTPYAAASNYLLNNTLHNITDANVPTKTAFETGLTNTTRPTEIMSNFFSDAQTAPAGYFELPEQVKQIINDDPNYQFVGAYNGQKSIIDSVRVQANNASNPYIITRNEAGVHIIGIDRWTEINKAPTYEGKINEIKNTILWRYILGEFSLNQNTGFTLDLKTELQTYFKENRDRLLFDYIIQNETTPPQDPKNYIFSDSFTNIGNIPALRGSTYEEYLTAWNIYTKTLKKTSHKDLVKEKLLASQTAYTDKIYGNSVIGNGIAGILPYARTTTANTDPTIANNGVVNKTYGTYRSLDVYKPVAAAAAYTEEETQALLNNIENTLTPNLYSKLETQKIGMKNLTYPSAKYNQYLEIGTSKPPKDLNSSVEYVADGDVLNDTVATWISGDEPKNMVVIQKLLSDVNYDDSATSTDNVLDPTNWALAGSYASPFAMNAAPALPNANSTVEEKRAYVNYKLQESYDINKKIPLVFDNMAKDIENNPTYDQIIELSRKKWATEILSNTSGSTRNNDYIKEIATLKFAFDYNEKTGEYDFTKFRDFLVEQTANYKKAAYVWVTNERIDLIADSSPNVPYKNAATGIKEHYKFKGNMITKNAGAYGYAYQGAPNDYRTTYNGPWKDTVTFNDSVKNFNNVKLTPTGTSFSGFSGMQFESNSSSDLNPSIKEDLFSANIRVFDGYDAGAATAAPADTNIKIRGALYNIGTLNVFQNLIRTEIYSWPQANQLAKWLYGTFGIDTSGVSTTNLENAKNELIVLTNQLPTEVFDRNVSSLLVNKNYDPIHPGASNNPAFYYDGLTTGYSNTAVFTQFRQSDVIALFDTSGDGLITDADKGIDWTSATTNGFLGSSAEAFFMSAFDWYNNQTSFQSTSFNAVIERQSKILAYDRRINNSFGKALVQNFKEDNTSE